MNEAETNQPLTLESMMRGEMDDSREEGRKEEEKYERESREERTQFILFIRQSLCWILHAKLSSRNRNLKLERVNSSVSSSGRSAPGHKDAPKFASLPPPSPSQG